MRKNKELEFMIITNDPIIARIAYNNNVRVMIDIERNGKAQRQSHKDTFISDHTLEDLSILKKELPEADFILRVNPFHENTEFEIMDGIARGANHIMLPMFRTVDEVKKTSDFINGKTNLIPLVETSAALVRLNSICLVDGIKEIHLGLNDLSIDMGLDFLFEPLYGGIVDLFCDQARKHNKIYGFGGISTIGTGKILAEDIIKEHARLGSQRVILSRSFIRNIFSEEEDIMESNFSNEIRKIRMIYSENRVC